MNGDLEISKRNNANCKSLKRRSTFSDNNTSTPKLIKLNKMKLDNSFQPHNNYITDSLIAESHPSFPDSFQSLIYPSDDVSAYELITPIIDLPKKFDYKVTEIYQIGFQVGDTERIYIPNILDFQDVSYQYQSNIKLDESTVHEIWNELTPMILSSDYQQEYSNIEQQGMSQLEEYLSINLSHIISKTKLQEKQTMMNYYQRIVDLRLNMHQMFSKIFTEIKFSSKFNPSSQDIDRLIDHLTIVQMCCVAKTRDEYIELIQRIPDRDSLDPVVVLCRDLRSYYRELQQKCLKLINVLLPQLELPKEFNLDRDLISLICRICSVNGTNNK